MAAHACLRNMCRETWGFESLHRHFESFGGLAKVVVRAVLKRRFRKESRFDAESHHNALMPKMVARGGLKILRRKPCGFDARWGYKWDDANDGVLGATVNRVPYGLVSSNLTHPSKVGWQSGLMQRSWKPSNVMNVPWVQILHLPPYGKITH